MNDYAMTNQLVERRPERKNRMDEYYSAEFSVNGVDVRYQFKIWNIKSMPMCVLIKENSNLLPQLKVGTTLSVKYYATDSSNPPECLQTAIRNITRNDEGRFKGHYLVGLEIL
jgi:hypothetical protein